MRQVNAHRNQIWRSSLTSRCIPLDVEWHLGHVRRGKVVRTTISDGNS